MHGSRSLCVGGLHALTRKNDPTAVKRHRFENITTDFIIGRTLFVEGHKALPSTDTNLAR